METARTQGAEENLHVLAPNNPTIPQQHGVCFISKLPPELLSRIFGFGPAGNVTTTRWVGNDTEVIGRWEMEEVIGDEDEVGGEEWTDTTGSTSSDVPLPSFPFTIFVSHVCRLWRNIALSTPSLWTTIIFPHIARPPYKLQSMLLERSRSLPIDIYVPCQSDDGNKFLFSMLIPEIHRWRTIKISVSNYHHIHEFLSAVSDLSTPAAPRLTILELYYFRDIDYVGYLSMSKHFTLFGGLAPSLTRLALWGVYVDWNQPWIASASNLTSFELGAHPEDIRPSWVQFATILRSASNLERLCLRVSAPSGDPTEWFIEPTAPDLLDPNAPIRLARLTELILAVPLPEHAIGLLCRLHLPALKNLDLHLNSDHDGNDLVHELVRPTVSLFAVEEQPRNLLSGLETLRIACLPCVVESVEMIYGELENLTSLNIGLTDLDAWFLDILGTPCTLPGRGGTWLPRLVTLYVGGTSGKVLRDVVRKRRDAGVPLRSLYIEQSCGVEDVDLIWLRMNLKTVGFFDELALGYD